jgi:Zn-dependent protease with chaperone function
MKKHLKLFGMVAGIPLLGLVTSLSAKSNEYTSLLLPASLIGLTSGVLLLACIYFLAKYAASNRTLLLRIFSPGIKVVLVTLFCLTLVQGWVAVCSIYTIGRLLLHYSLAPVTASIGFATLVGAVVMLKKGLLISKRVSIHVLGHVLSKSGEPTLWNLVNRVAKKLGAKPPRNIVIGLEPTFYVTSADVMVIPEEELQQEETLYLSLPLMSLLSVDELTAVIGHELAHFSGDDVTFSIGFYPIYAGTIGAIEALVEKSDNEIESIALQPALAVLSFFMEHFATAVATIGREREVLADLAGISVSSKQALALALLKISAYIPTWHAVMAAAIEDLHNGKAYPNIFTRFVEQTVSADIATTLDALSVETLTHPTDSHPPTRERISAIGLSLDELRSKVSPTDCFTSSISCLSDYHYLEAELVMMQHRFMLAAGMVPLVYNPLNSRILHGQHQEQVTRSSTQMWPFTRKKAEQVATEKTADNGEEQDKRYMMEFHRNITLKQLIPSHHYDFVHVILREVFQTMPELLVERIMHAKFECIKTLWEMTCEASDGATSEYFGLDNINVHLLNICAHPVVLTLMPPPIVYTDAYMSAAVVLMPDDLSSEDEGEYIRKVAYLTLERGIGQHGVETYLLCGWNGNQHINLETDLPELDPAMFLAAVEGVLKEFPDKLVSDVPIQKWDAISQTVHRFYPEPESVTSNEHVVTPVDESETKCVVVTSATDCMVHDPDIADNYSGESVGGVAHGKGVAKGRDEYVGEFKNGKKHGQGTYTWGEDSEWAGQVFSGESVEDEMVKGTWTFKKENVIKQGIFRNNMLNGFGSMTNADGVVLEGYRKNNKLQGFVRIKVPKSLKPDPKARVVFTEEGDYWVRCGYFCNGDFLMPLL